MRNLCLICNSETPILVYHTFRIIYYTMNLLYFYHVRNFLNTFFVVAGPSNGDLLVCRLLIGNGWSNGEPASVDVGFISDLPFTSKYIHWSALSMIRCERYHPTSFACQVIEKNVVLLLFITLITLSLVGADELSPFPQNIWLTLYRIIYSPERSFLSLS